MEEKRFGRLVTGDVHHKDKSYNKYYTCKCDCGNEAIVRYDKLVLGKTKSCGCLAAERVVELQTVAAIEDRKYTKSSYTAMINRCYNKNQNAYLYYGAKGIHVCNRWLYGEDGKNGWTTFFLDMGPRPRGTSIDRIDNAKGYFPENCRWATKAEQSRNRSCVKLDEFDAYYVRNSDVSHRDAALELGVGRDHIKAIRKNKAWIETPAVKGTD